MVTDTMMQVLKHYNQALVLYKSRKFQEAKDEFGRALALSPNDGPSKMYIERCDDYLEEPPPEDWDGVYNMKTK